MTSRRGSHGLLRRAAPVAATGALSAFLLFAHSSAEALVSGSPHDLVSQGYHVPRAADQQEACLACHMPPGARMRPFLTEPPAVLDDFDSASLSCFSCHDGTTMVNPNVDASLTAFHPRSHGYGLEGYRDQLPTDGSIPHLSETRMTCLSCHDAHSNDTRPFLRLGLVNLCRACHARLENNRSAAPEENYDDHPVLVDPHDRAGNRIPVTTAAAFREPFPSTYPLSGGKDSAGVHWDLGGHLEGGENGRIVCITCHAVHGDEEAAPRDYLLSADPVNRQSNEFCEGCHRGRRGDGKNTPPFPNPGATVTARTYHPADNDAGGADRPVFEVRKPPDWPYGSAPGQPILCTTCHVAHGGSGGTALLRTTGSGDFCEGCHDSLPLANHHGMGTGTCAENIPGPRYGGTPGKMHCSSCHRAHNAGLGKDEEQFVPILRFGTSDNDFCYACHPEDNPTCQNDPLAMASHFMGNPRLAETFEDENPPLWEEPWPESGLMSRYGGTKESPEIICLSCHAFKEGALSSGDDEKPVHLVARAGNSVEWDPETEDADMVYLCTGCHSSTPATDPGEAGSGATHPLMDADIVNLKGTPRPPVSATPSGNINCDSCHRSHGARTASGYYILEVVNGANTDPRFVHPQIDFTTLCHHCHSATEY